MHTYIPLGIASGYEYMDAVNMICRLLDMQYVWVYHHISLRGLMSVWVCAYEYIAEYVCVSVRRYMCVRRYICVRRYVCGGICLKV